MTSRIFLIVDPQGAQGFEYAKLRSTLQSIGGVIIWREGDETIHSDSLLVQCEVRRDDMEVLVRVSSDLLSLYIDGDTVLCCDVATEIGRQYGDEVFAYAEDSLPHIASLGSITSSADLFQELKLMG